MSESVERRVERYVERYFQRHHQTEWPTVRRVAGSLRLTHRRVEEAVDGHPSGNLMLTGYNVEGDRFGDLFVETINPPEATP